MNLGCEIKYKKVNSIDQNKNVLTNNNKYQAKKIIIATGVENKKLLIENEDNLLGKGISYYATCDINFYKLDIDNAYKIAEQYQIMSIPTILIFNMAN